MDKPMHPLLFRGMAIEFRLRDLFSPPGKTLAEVGIRPGSVVLDFGCGPGGYSMAAAEQVGASGKVYALDIHPLAIRAVRRRAAKRALTNIETILSDRATGLSGGCGDVALLYDTLHDVGDRKGILEELHRALKADGLLSFRDHRAQKDDLLSTIPGTGLFRPARKGERTYTFWKTP